MKIYHLFIIAVCTAFSSGVSAQEQLETSVGSGTVLEVGSEVTRVALADEDIASVTVLEEGELLIHGRANGRTTLFVWTADNERKAYQLRVNRDLQALNSAVDIINGDIEIEESADSRTLLLKGEVATQEDAESAGKRILEVLATLPEPRPGLVNLLTYPDVDDPKLGVDAGLLAALHAIDERIILRRIRVDEKKDPDGSTIGQDSYVMEGKVKTIRDLAKAIYLADRQLGGTGGKIQAMDESKIRSNRRSSFNTNFGVGSGSGSGSGALNNAELIPNGLAAQLARGLILSSQSGRVISFMEVDRLEQIMVSIRVLEIDRQKARNLGVNYQIDGDKLSVGSFNVPSGQRFGVTGFGGANGVNSVAGLGGNLAASYVSDTASLLAAVNVLQEKAVARSVAEPNVLTLTGEEASVLVGGEVPIPSTAIGNVASVQGFDFQSFGVRLNIRPTITEDGMITLEVAPSIVRPNLGLGNGDVPGFEVQTVQTTARVPAGNSLLLGGLLTFEEGREERGIPILSRIPLIGYLFKWDKKLRDEKELLFVMSPRVIDESHPQDIPELPQLDSRDHHRVHESIEPQKLERDGVPELWRTPEPKYPPDLWPDGPDHHKSGTPIPAHLNAADPMPSGLKPSPAKAPAPAKTEAPAEADAPATPAARPRVEVTPPRVMTPRAILRASTRKPPQATPITVISPAPPVTTPPPAPPAPAPAPALEQKADRLDPNAPMPLRNPSKKVARQAAGKLDLQALKSLRYRLVTTTPDARIKQYRMGLFPFQFDLHLDPRALRDGGLPAEDLQRSRVIAQQLKGVAAAMSAPPEQIALVDTPVAE